MCQGLLCFSSGYFSCCHQWLGCSVGLLCCSCWLCPSHPIGHMRGTQCNKCGCGAGLGCTALFAGFYCCVPKMIQDYSVWSSVSGRVGEIYNIVISRQAIIDKEDRQGSSRELK